MSTPALSVVIVNYNTVEETSACLRSVFAATTAEVEVVVVDNGSTDASAAVFRERFPEVTVVEPGGNVGFAAGVNHGVRASSAPWVVLLNPDTIVLDGALDALLAFAEEHPAYGLYGGRTLRPDGTTDPSSCWGQMTVWSLVCFATGLSTVFKRSPLFDPESLGRWERDTVREVPIITGCLLLISRRAWDRLEGMDERFFLYGEDADFSARARAAGIRPVIVPDATIVHAVGGSTASSGRKMSMVMAGKATTLRTHWRAGTARLGISLLQAGALVRSIPARLRGRRHPTWDVVWERRADWRDGYPTARSRIFTDAATSEQSIATRG